MNSAFPMGIAAEPLPTTRTDIMNAGQRVLGHDWTPGSRVYVGREAQTYLRRLRKLRASELAGKRHQRRGRSFFVEHSFAGRFCSLLLGYPKRGRKLTLAEAEAMAMKVSLRKSSSEIVRVHEHQKPEGGHRATSCSGPLDRAADRLADDMLRVIWRPSAYDFSRKGRGRDTAIRNGLQNYNEGGARRFVKADLKEFFQSVDQEFLFQMIPLPRAVIRETILIPITKIISFDKHAHTSETTVRAGLPQGSRPSQTIASKIIETLLDGLPAELMAMNYGDDILVGVRTDAEAIDVKNALVSLAAKHPAGPFTLKWTEVIRLGVENDWIGYKFRKRLPTYGGGARVSVSAKSVLRFQRRIARGLICLPWSKCLEVAEERCRRWALSFGEWGGRHVGADLAFYDLQWEVFPAVREFRRFVRTRKINFGSFEEIFQLFEMTFLSSVGKSATILALPQSKQPLGTKLN